MDLLQEAHLPRLDTHIPILYMYRLVQIIHTSSVDGVVQQKAIGKVVTIDLKYGMEIPA